MDNEEKIISEEKPKPKPIVLYSVRKVSQRGGLVLLENDSGEYKIFSQDAVPGDTKKMDKKFWESAGAAPVDFGDLIPLASDLNLALWGDGYFASGVTINKNRISNTLARVSPSVKDVIEKLKEEE